MAAPVFTVAVNTNTSDTVDLNGTTLVGLFVPTGFDGTVINIQATIDGSNFYDVEDGDGADLELTVGTVPCYVPVAPTLTAGLRMIRLRTGTTQGQETLIPIASREV